MPQHRPSLLADLSNAARGVCMGAADVVPGVSGGTVALVLGIYERLVTAISHFDRRLLGMLRGGRWREAAAHCDLRFLVSLLCGIGLGFLAMTLAMHRLLTNENSRELTMAAFFGMIAASSILVALRIRITSAFDASRVVLLGVVGTALALLFVWLRLLPGQSLEPSYPYIFLCGAIAICAMILPGISGAMMLLLLGVYTHLIGVPERMLHGEGILDGLITIAVFGAGCAVTLLGFSKVLRWLLTRYHNATMALLCGLMFGSLPMLWPFQVDLTPQEENWKLKRFWPELPAAFDGRMLAAVGVALAAMAVVLAAHWITHGRGGRAMFAAGPLCEERTASH